MLAHLPDDLYRIQALLLLALASFARLDCQEGTDALTEAVEAARRLHLDTEAYAQRQPAVLQESCRRTLWELFVVTTLVKSILGIDIRFDLADCDVFLPGNCNDYERNRPPARLRTLMDMQNRFLSDTDFPWSGFAYKVEATRILQTVLDTERSASVQHRTYDACQASISSWWLSLPTDKGLDSTKRDADADECMFFALMVINMASLRINLPRSDLSPAWREATLCSPMQSQSSARDASYHTAGALKAANTLSSLIASEGSSKLHTPCSACAIAFGTIVQLPAYLQEPDNIKCSSLKENIQLGLTYLKRMGEIWPMAFAVRGQLATLARQVLSTPRKRDSALLQGVQAASSGHHPVIDARQTVATDPGDLQSIDSVQVSSGGDRWLEFARETLTDSTGSGSTHSGSVQLDGEDNGWLQDLINIPTDSELMHDFLGTPSQAGTA